jgi:two-component system, OmpR family, KDP operon response regulator KdpE
MSEPAVILVVEDEAHARAVLQVTLKQQGYFCLHAPTGMEGVAAALEREPAVVLLDLGLPDLDGVEVTRRIRARSAVPIIVVSARGQEEHKVEALDEGANDYVTKPFVAGELLARIRVALRNTRGVDQSLEAGSVTIGDLTVDFDLRRVTVEGREVYLTSTEYRMLGVMIRSRGRVLSNRQILRQVWGPRFDDQVGYLRVYMKKLRYKIEREPAQPRYLINEPGVGYRLRLPG